MERATAIKKLQRVLGPKAYWRVGEQLSSDERRRAATLIYLEADFQRALLNRDREDLRRRLLDVPEYAALTHDLTEAIRRREQHAGQSH